jgi:hypothetical protein
MEFLKRNFRKGGANLRVCHDVPAATFSEISFEKPSNFPGRSRRNICQGNKSENEAADVCRPVPMAGR